MKKRIQLGIVIGFFAINGSALAQPALKDAYAGKFLVGAALNQKQFTELNAAETALIAKHFNTITPENALKWESLHPQLDKYDFTAADRYVEFGEKHDMFIIGHTLVWHHQTPADVFEENGKPASREVLLERMRTHIHIVVGRYKGRVKGWDVVNEALEKDGSLRQSPWLRIIGKDYIQKAFEFAHEADPAAELYYNDYSIENEPKRNGAIALVKQLQAAGVKVSGIGIQEHVSLNWPTPKQLDATLTAFGKLGIKTMITELDVDVLPGRNNEGSAEISLRNAANPKLNPYTNSLPAEMQQTLAKRYAELFTVYCKHSSTLSRVTFWGVTDGDSWLNDWPIPGRTSYPLLFDRQGKSKPAFNAVIQAISTLSTNKVVVSGSSNPSKSESLIQGEL
jgi:endo-1,4-beta-xylanase